MRALHGVDNNLHFVSYVDTLDASLEAKRAKKYMQIIKSRSQQAEPAATNEDVPLRETHSDLLCKVASGDKAAFVVLFDHFAPRIKSYFISRGMDEVAADDLAQEALLNVWRRASSYDPSQSAASTWIFTVARNKRIDILRKNQRRHAVSTDPNLMQDIEIDESPLQDSQIIAASEADIVKKAVDDLPEEQARMIRMSFFEDMTHNDIAEQTGIPLGTVKSRIRLALGRLKKAMPNNGEDKI